MKAIESDPFYSYPSYWALVSLFKRQSRYGAGDIISFFDGLLHKHPALRESRLYMNYYAYFNDSKKWEDRIESWLAKDLEEIIKLCRENNIRLILQNYPYTYTRVNETLENTAMKFNVHFVDNHSVFQAFLTKDNYSDYFYDDEHCTPIGHQVMAENVFKTLQRILE